MKASASNPLMADQRPIGIFDSGIGGLTVLKALQLRLPAESFVYLGDMARLPYGTKTGETITRYAVQAAEALIDQNVKLLVVACNTASAHALKALQLRFPDTPVIGVIDPGAAAAAAASKSGRIAVIATESTARANAYRLAICKHRPDAEVTTIACGLLVALAEEGWLEGDIPHGIVKRYLEPVFAEDKAPDTLVLGCTHFPLLRGVIETMIGSAVTLIDSGAVTAEIVARLLQEKELAATATGRFTSFMATDGTERFARLATYFLGLVIAPDAIQLIDLQAGHPVNPPVLSARKTDRAARPAQKAKAG